MMIEDEELKQFYLWIQRKGDDPNVMLALKWIAEFERYAEEDEEGLRDFKAFLKERDGPDAAAALRSVTEFEETEEPDPILKRLRDWLKAKGNDATAVLVEWWLTEFERECMGEDGRESSKKSPAH